LDLQADSQNNTTKCGYVAIVGRPNVGKSSLLNKLINEKVSITSRRPQTTRHRIIGIHTNDARQIIFIDTPGMHSNRKTALSRYMNRTAESALHSVDVIFFVVDAGYWLEHDARILEMIKEVKCPVFLLVNKVDKISNKEELLPFLQACEKRRSFHGIYPISAKHGTNLDLLMKEVGEILPYSPFYYHPEQVTDRDKVFQITEIIREKIMRILGQELPYATTVTLIDRKKEGEVWHLHGVIFVERDSQKPIVIGDGGLRIREISRQARLDIERLLDSKVFLRLFVKVKSQWSDDEKTLSELGYGDDN